MVDYEKKEQLKKELHEQRKKLMDLDEKSKKENVRELVIRRFKEKTFPIAFTASLAVTLGISSVGVYMNSNVRKIRLLDRDIRIHSGTEDPVEGHDVNPYYEHSCVIGSSDEGTVEERIQKYCEKYELSDDVLNKAIERYQLLLTDNKDEANEIDLVEVYNESKKQQKSFKK